MKTLSLAGRELATGLRFPEGPIARPDGTLILVEIERGTLVRINLDGSMDVIAHLGGGPNGAAIGPGDKCYVCNNGGLSFVTHPDGYLRPVGKASDYSGGRIERVDLTTGAVETVYTQCNGLPLRGPNDLVFDECGSFWFTDSGKAHERHIERGAVYYARADGSLIKEALFPILTPNGIGLSPDEKMLYVAETETARLWEYEIRGEGGIAKMAWPSPHGGRLLQGLPGYHRFDSMAVEAGGNICVATLMHGGITVVSPQGELLEFWETADSYCTNICFGGPDLRTAYVTLGGYGKLIAVEWPRPGLALPYVNRSVI